MREPQVTQPERAATQEGGPEAGTERPVDGRRPARGRGRERRTPERPAELGGSGWWATLKRTVHEFRADNLTDWGAALTYYGVLALFPALIALVSIIGLIGSSATQPLIDNLGKLTSGPANQILTGAVKQIAASRGGAGIAFVAGLLGALWSASGYVGAFARASNSIYDVREGRPFWKLRPLQLLITAVMIMMLALAAVAVVVTGPLARQVGNVVGAGSSAVSIWDIAKWPVIVIVISLMLSVLYYAAPNVKHPSFRWISPGGLIGVGVWLLASAAFALYVANFASYNKTYGTLGGVVSFLVWLWISNLAFLLGAEFNAELERGRQIAAGAPSDQEPFLPPRQSAEAEHH